MNRTHRSALSSSSPRSFARKEDRSREIISRLNVRGSPRRGRPRSSRESRGSLRREVAAPLRQAVQRRPRDQTRRARDPHEPMHSADLALADKLSSFSRTGSRGEGHAVAEAFEAPTLQKEISVRHFAWIWWDPLPHSLPRNTGDAALPRSRQHLRSGRTPLPGVRGEDLCRQGLRDVGYRQHSTLPGTIDRRRSERTVRSRTLIQHR